MKADLQAGKSLVEIAQAKGIAEDQTKSKTALFAAFAKGPSLIVSQNPSC